MSQLINSEDQIFSLDNSILISHQLIKSSNCSPSWLRLQVVRPEKGHLWSTGLDGGDEHGQEDRVRAGPRIPCPRSKKGKGPVDDNPESVYMNPIAFFWW